MPTPIIGLTSSHTSNRNGYPVFSVMEAYVQAVAQAGGAPLLIPTGLTDEALASIYSRLDGVLFTGGGDVHPELYGSQPHPRVEGVDGERDRLEIELARQAVRSGLPFLGICRGLQVINVALGGTLYEDILDQMPGALDHASPDERPRNYLAHAVEIDPASQLARILGGSSVHVNSLHHQGLRQPASGIQVTARAPDGMIEAFELPGHPFGLAVQWHPEWLQEHQPMRELFQAFVQAAGKT